MELDENLRGVFHQRYERIKVDRAEAAVHILGGLPGDYKDNPGLIHGNLTDILSAVLWLGEYLEVAVDLDRAVLDARACFEREKATWVP